MAGPWRKSINKMKFNFEFSNKTFSLLFSPFDKSIHINDQSYYQETISYAAGYSLLKIRVL